MAYYDDDGKPVIIETSGESSSTGREAIWAITTLLIILILAGVAYFGFRQISHNTHHDVNIKIDAPVNR